MVFVNKMSQVFIYTESGDLNTSGHLRCMCWSIFNVVCEQTDLKLSTCDQTTQNACQYQVETGSLLLFVIRG